MADAGRQQVGKMVDERPGHLIRRLQQISFAIFMNEARAFDVTPVQYSAIFAISNQPGIDQTALCHMIAFDRSTIGDVVTRLERKKLIRRRNGPLDRRTKSLYVTPLGRRLLRDIAPAVAATQRLILAPLAAGDRDAFMRMLKTLVLNNNERSRAPLRPKAGLRRGAGGGARGVRVDRPQRSRRTGQAASSALAD
jgi:MarR family transcriptional regulator, lower aerobic nicotinate degradation pathway regulator